MKKILIIFSGIILSCIMVYGIWICVVNRNTDDYLDNDNVSREIISYKGDKNNLEYNIIMCNYKKIKGKRFILGWIFNPSKSCHNDC